MLVMVNNLAGETRDDVVLRLSEKWRGASVARLGMDGVWQPVGNVEGRIWRPSFALRHMMPEFFRLTRCGVAGGARYTPDVAARKQVRGAVVKTFAFGSGETAHASYTLAADDLYVRARVESNESATYPNAISKMHPPMKVGWTQPYRQVNGAILYIHDVSV